MSRVLVAVLVFAVAALGAVSAFAQDTAAPLRATLFLRTPGNTFHPTDPATPLGIIVRIENPSNRAIITMAGFSATEFWRQLFFTDPQGGVVKNADAHPEARQAGQCHSRQGVLQRPTALPVFAVEVLGGIPSTALAVPGSLAATPASGALPARPYFYRVTALNAAGEESGPSTEVMVTPATGAVSLSWSAVSNAVGYRVYRGTTAGRQTVFYRSPTNTFLDIGEPASPGTPPPFFIEYVIEDARGEYHLHEEGTYRVQALIPLQTFGVSSVIRDCDQFDGDVAPIRGGTGRQQFVIASNMLEFSIRADRTPPTTTLAGRSPAPNAAGWNNGPVTLRFNAVDAAPGSGVSRLIVVTTNGNQTAEHIFQPAAGSQSVTADLPITGEGTTVVRYRAFDAAGNVEAEKMETVRIDRIPPVVTIALNPAAGPYLLNQLVTIAYAATETAGPAASGLAGAAAGTITKPITADVIPVATGAPVTMDRAGTWHVRATAKDAADNEGVATAQIAVGYRFSGFLSPLGSDSGCGTLPCRTVRRGSTVPVRFEATDVNGVAISTVVAHIAVTRVNSNVQLPPEIDLGTGAADSGNRFRFNGQQYIFNLDTTPLTGAPLWRIDATLDDGSIHSVHLGVR